jgi:sulfur transfer complex TusBCD TusB component (DsrH family)
MALLHTVNKSPFEKSSLETCLDYGGFVDLVVEHDATHACL